jgi:hypothetical protein
MLLKARQCLGDLLPLSILCLCPALCHNGRNPKIGICAGYPNDLRFIASLFRLPGRSRQETNLGSASTESPAQPTQGQTPKFHASYLALPSQVYEYCLKLSNANFGHSLGAHPLAWKIEAFAGFFLRFPEFMDTR